MKISIVGSILGSTGYDSHCRQLVNALYKINPDIKLDVHLTPNYLDLVNDAELEMIKTPYRVPDVTVAIMTPPFWRVALGDNCKKFVGFCVWEGDKIPKYWIPYLMNERVDQIWVPSQHTKDAIIKTLEEKHKDLFCKTGLYQWVESMIKIVPHGVNTELFKPKEKDPQPNFSFLCNKGWRGGMEDRGGVQYLLKAFTEEFSKDENVELNIHLNPAYMNPAILNQKMDELKLDKDSPPVKISMIDIPYNKLPNLYQQADCYVCATRAESFDLGTAEAMACGLPIITTGYGGQIEHMNDDCAEFIDYELEEVKGDVMYEGICWATPNVENLKKLLRSAYNASNDMKKKGKAAKKYIQDWTWDNSAKKAMECLKEL